SLHGCDPFFPTSPSLLVTNLQPSFLLASFVTEQAGDKFIVLASDGVWEFISSQEAVDIVNVSLEE
ncbi:unnamed protein product, partial [Scytosiphon promiscuus]